MEVAQNRRGQLVQSEMGLWVRLLQAGRWSCSISQCLGKGPCIEPSMLWQCQNRRHSAPEGADDAVPEAHDAATCICLSRLGRPCVAMKTYAGTHVCKDNILHCTPLRSCLIDSAVRSQASPAPLWLRWTAKGQRCCSVRAR